MTPDPITLELYRHRFSGIAEEMGITLQRTSYSPNIKERLDFSCALFDGSGRLVAQAPGRCIGCSERRDSRPSIAGRCCIGGRRSSSCQFERALRWRAANSRQAEIALGRSTDWTEMPNSHLSTAGRSGIGGR